MQRIPLRLFFRFVGNCPKATGRGRGECACSCDAWDAAELSAGLEPPVRSGMEQPRTCRTSGDRAPAEPACLWCPRLQVPAHTLWKARVRGLEPLQPAPPLPRHCTAGRLALFRKGVLADASTLSWKEKDRVPGGSAAESGPWFSRAASWSPRPGGLKGRHGVCAKTASTWSRLAGKCCLGPGNAGTC